MRFEQWQLQDLRYGNLSISMDVSRFLLQIWHANEWNQASFKNDPSLSQVYDIDLNHSSAWKQKGVMAIQRSNRNCNAIFNSSHLSGIFIQCYCNGTRRKMILNISVVDRDELWLYRQSIVRCCLFVVLYLLEIKCKGRIFDFVTTKYSEQKKKNHHKSWWCDLRDFSCLLSEHFLKGDFITPAKYHLHAHEYAVNTAQF